jgi:uncharacterized membrane protein
MPTTMRTMVTAAKVGAIAALGLGAILGVASGTASAAGKGNTVHNCYGVYFSTDWNQDCGAGGAELAGVYNSTGDCTGSADRSVGRQRAKGDTTSIDGGDCRFQVINVRTSYQ